jgi:ribonuclease HI
MREVILYSDGASSGNPGPGGFGTILMSGSLVKEISEGYKLTTNNRMELMGVIRGLEALKKEGTTVKVFSDSKYVVDAINKGWVFEWEKKGFHKKSNPDLWMRLLKLIRKHNISFHWVKGHANNPYNNRCDELAVLAAKGRNLQDDTGYSGSKTGNGLFQ